MFLLALVFCLTQVSACLASPSPDECSNYSILDDASRSTNYAVDEDYCDGTGTGFTSPDWSGPALYRMMQPAGSQLPEATPGREHCGTYAAGWLDAAHPTDQFQTSSNVRVCFDWGPLYNHGCFDEITINITNCGPFYVYQLPNTPGCMLRYCALNPDELNMEEEKERSSQEGLF